MKRNLYPKWLVMAAFLGSTAMMSAQTSEAPEAMVDFTISESTGQWTSSNATKTWHAQWTSNQQEPKLTLNCGANNMAYTTDGIKLFTGNNTAGFSANYSLAVSAGYNIVAYSFEFTNEPGKTLEIVVTPQGKDPQSHNGQGDAQLVAVTGVNNPSATFNVKHAGLSQAGFAFVKNFNVTVQKDPNAIIPQYLYITNSGETPHRIPALARTKDGHLLAFSDYRPSGNDIGYGDVDIKLRISTDNGVTWGAERTIADGDNGTTVTAGFGDAAVVGDRESNEVLMLCVAGRTPYQTANYLQGNPNRMVRFVSKNGGQDWEEFTELTDQVYGLFEPSTTPIQSMFVGSGKLIQSTTIKAEGANYYRIYAPLCARPGGNRVMYSDDFGVTWQALGGINACPIPAGDEPKCEELPDGRIVLSSRVSGGRLFNIFSYTDAENGQGNWSTAAKSDASNNGVVAESNACNGEIMILPVKRNSDDQQMFLALQSVPFGPNRSNVGIYYKALETLNDYVDPAAFAKDWTGRKQISHQLSAYSTMVFQADDKIGFFYEEKTHGGEYTNVYAPLTLEQITNGQFTYDPTVKRPTADDNAITAADIEKAKELLQNIGLGYPTLEAEARANLEELVEKPAGRTKPELADAVQAFLNETDIELPEEGKLYTLTFIAADKKQYYLNYDGAKVRPVLRGEGALPASAFFQAKVLENGDEEVLGLMTEDGKFLSYPTKDPAPTWLTGHSTDAVTDLNPAINALNFVKALPGDKTVGVTNEDLLGLFYIQSLRGFNSTDNTPVAGYWVVKTTDQTYDGTDTPFFNANYSSLIKIERVVHPLGKQVTMLDEIESDKAYALYNAHFTSYAIKKKDQNNIWVAGMRGDSGHTLSNPEFSLDLDLESAYGGWQLIKDNGGNFYLYNIGAQQFAQTPNTITACTFTSEQTPIEVTQLDGGFAFNTNGGRTQYFCAAPQLSGSPIAVWTADDDGSKWVLIENPNLLADYEVVKTITAIKNANLQAAPAAQGIFNLAGQRLNVADPRQLPRGLYIVNGRKYLVK